jgi:hypothetical protein
MITGAEKGVFHGKWPSRTAFSNVIFIRAPTWWFNSKPHLISKDWTWMNHLELIQHLFNKMFVSFTLFSMSASGFSWCYHSSYSSCCAYFFPFYLKWELSADEFPFNLIRKGRVYTLIPDDGLNPSTFELRKFYPSFCFIIHIFFRRVQVCPGRWRIDILFLSPIDIAWSF